MNEPVIEIRLAVPEDVAVISAILAEAFAEYEPLYTKESFAATTPSSAAIRARFPEGQMWMALLDGKIAGTVWAVPRGEHLHVRSMAILPSARGNKIGERLLESIEKFALERGYRRLTLSTTPFLDRAIRLYEKFGFVRVGDEDLYGTPLITMKKDL